MSKTTKKQNHPAASERAEKSKLGSVFRKATEVNLGDFQELTRPPIVRMRDMEVGDVIDGKIVDVLPSNQKSIRNPVLVLVLTNGGDKVSIPAQAVIQSALLPEYDGDNAEHKAEPAKLCPYVGKRVFIKLTGHKESKKFTQDDGKTPREFAVYDIAVAKK